MNMNKLFKPKLVFVKKNDWRTETTENNNERSMKLGVEATFIKPVYLF